MGRPIDSQELRNAMYHEAFETDSDEQMWDSGCWIRYKMFERILNSMPSAQPEITLESAIDYLHSIGWMQEHDRVLTERKNGRWVYDRLETTSGCFYGVRRCSECGMIGGGTRYCPYCGADMRTPTQVQLDEADDVMMGGDNGKTD